MNKYLESSEFIDWESPEVLEQAKSLSKNLNSNYDIVSACFNFVRDEVHHSLDFKLNPITCKASEVLKYATGYCYAKSHLLAALLRANSIPAGLCYQRLTIMNDVPPYCLHGLNAVFLEDFGWYRIDPRGNKSGINAQFNPPKEQLAFPILVEGEADLIEIRSEPLPIVIDILNRYDNYIDVANNLPDIDVLKKH